MNNKDLTIMLQYKYRKTDQKLLTKKSEMIQLYNAWYTPALSTFQPSPPISPAVSDGEEINNSDNDKNISKYLLKFKINTS